MVSAKSPQIVLFIRILQCCMIIAIGFSWSGRDGNFQCKERERQALLMLKQGLVDDYGLLSSWGSEDEKTECCRWRGIQCNNRTGHVVRLDLQAPYEQMRLRGKISSSLLELRHLNYLDLSWNDFSQSCIPEFIGSLTNLRYLNLSHANFSGTIPHQPGNLSCYGGSLKWLSHLPSLEHLDLSLVNLDKANDWVQLIHSLPYLKNLLLSDCDLPNINPKSLSLINSSTSLATLDLSRNNLTSLIYRWLFNPNAFGNLTSLEHLDLSFNRLDGEIPKSLGNLCSLQTLNLQDNNISGHLTGFAENLSGCKQNSLQVLDLSHNQLAGSLPDLTRLSSLQELHLSFNRINGTVPKSLGHLSNLEVLDVASNSLEGLISETHFSNLSKLKHLDLSFNSLALDFRNDWVPPFQLDSILLPSCKLGPLFPKWILTQNSFVHLDISGAEISDSIPSSFWDLSPKLTLLNLSCNHFNGPIANSSSKYIHFPQIDLSSNGFEGPIPPFLSQAATLNLSTNKFSGPISFLCTTTNGKLSFLDLCNNQLSGELPNCWMHLKDLVILNLSNNKFSGKIPDSMGFLSSIQTLQINHNRLTGELPSSLKNCRELTFIGLAENNFSGTLPAWIGHSLSKLEILILRSNQFHGSMPLGICHLAHIQLLDISENNISGRIPKCLNNLMAMARNRNTSATMPHLYAVYISSQSTGFEITYIDTAFLVWKGRVFAFTKILGFVKLIDLSSNQLTGEIPEEITNLVGLVSLNLSRNKLTGKISPNIGQLTSLNSLDLSRNQLSGEIPSSLAQINQLGVLDLSYNNLEGKIPVGTQLQSFNSSEYAGNAGLCGLPLPSKCPGDEIVQAPGISGIRENADNQEDEDGFTTPGFYACLVLGFAVGFWGVCGSLVLNSSWRYSYFNFMGKIEDWLCTTAAVKEAKLKRRLSS